MQSRPLACCSVVPFSVRGVLRCEAPWVQDVLPSLGVGPGLLTGEYRGALSLFLSHLDLLPCGIPWCTPGVPSQELPNGTSKVTVVEHMEVDTSLVHPLFR